MLNGEPGPNGGGRLTPGKGAGTALALLLAINLFNYIDRQILSATLPKIQLDATIFRPDDPNLGLKLGLLTTGFMVSYMLLAPLFGWLGDKVSRWAVVGGAVILWSLATGGTGLAAGYAVLLATRCLVGVGEAAYGPIAPSMLSDLYPVDHRGRIMSYFYLAIPVGSALGFVIGGMVAAAWGWRAAYHVVVIPGVVLGAICFLMRDRRQHAPAQPSIERRPAVGIVAKLRGYLTILIALLREYLAVLRELLRIRSFVLCCAGMTLSTFVLGGVAAWAPVYIFEREARFEVRPETVETLEKLRLSDGEPVIPGKVLAEVRGLVSPEVMTVTDYRAKLRDRLTNEELKQYGPYLDDAATKPGSLTTGTIGLYFGAIVVVAGLVATLLGGLAGDRLRNRGVRGAYFKVAGWGTVLGFPFFVGMLFAPFPLAWVLMFGAVFWLFFNTGPANTVLANVTRSDIRATAFAINILVIHLLGDAISPPIIGAIKDGSNLHDAFLFTSFLIPLAGLLWVAGAPHLDEDTRRAEDGGNPNAPPIPHQ